MATIWNPTVSASEAMSGSTEQIRYNWEGFEDWWSVDHSETFTGATSGAHTVGTFGVLLTGATSAISAVTSPGTGALALNTTLGEMQIYRYDSTTSAASWEGIMDSKFSRIRQGLGAQTIPSTAWTRLTSASTLSGSYDGLSEYSSTRYTADGNGYFLIIGSVQWPVSTDFNRGIAIYKNGSPISVKRRYGQGIRTLTIIDTISLVATDYIDVYAWHNYSASVDIFGGAIQISRLD